MGREKGWRNDGVLVKNTVADRATFCFFLLVAKFMQTPVQRPCQIIN